MNNMFTDNTFNMVDLNEQTRFKFPSEARSTNGDRVSDDTEELRISIEAENKQQQTKQSSNKPITAKTQITQTKKPKSDLNTNKYVVNDLSYKQIFLNRKLNNQAELSSTTKSTAKHTANYTTHNTTKHNTKPSAKSTPKHIANNTTNTMRINTKGQQNKLNQVYAPLDDLNSLKETVGKLLGTVAGLQERLSCVETYLEHGYVRQFTHFAFDKLWNELGINLRDHDYKPDEAVDVDVVEYLEKTEAYKTLCENYPNLNHCLHLSLLLRNKANRAIHFNNNSLEKFDPQAKNDLNYYMLNVNYLLEKKEIIADLDDERISEFEKLIEKITNGIVYVDFEDKAQKKIVKNNVELMLKINN
jgi:hypothetical protein